MTAPTTAEVRAIFAKAPWDPTKQDEAYRAACVVVDLTRHRDDLADDLGCMRSERDALAAEVARLREALAIACDWWGGCGHHYDDCPVDDAGELVETECAEARRVDELAAKGAGR